MKSLQFPTWEVEKIKMTIILHSISTSLPQFRLNPNNGVLKNDFHPKYNRNGAKTRLRQIVYFQRLFIEAFKSSNLIEPMPYFQGWNWILSFCILILPINASKWNNFITSLLPNYSSSFIFTLQMLTLKVDNLVLDGSWLEDHTETYFYFLETLFKDNLNFRSLIETTPYFKGLNWDLSPLPPPPVKKGGWKVPVPPEFFWILVWDP